MIARPRSGAPRRHRQAVGVLVLAVLLVGWFAGSAGAHPLGNYTVNRFRGITIAPDGIAIDYVLDLAEIPTFQARGAVAAAGSTERYAATRCEEIAANVTLQVGGAVRGLHVRSAQASFPSGEGGLATTRIECGLRSDGAVPQPTGELSLDDANATDRIGWQEITATGVGVTLQTELPAVSPSERLTRYPTGDAALVVPRLAQGRATFEIIDAAARLPMDGAPPMVADGAVSRRVDPLGALIGRGGEGWWAMLVALGTAAALGAFHGLAPGHGKTVVAAYLVGTKGTRRQAAGLAGVVALSHTFGVFVLGGVTAVAAATVPLERIYGWLQLGSAAIVIGLGVWLARSVLRSGRAHRHTHDGHDHHHDHDHDHDHDHGHDHTHEHVHDHTHGHGHGGVHRHGLLPHRHRVAWDQVDLHGPLRWRALLALGLSGGLVPSASAVIVLLGAVQLGRVGFGAALIIAFGAGLAAALVGVGLGVVAVSRRAGRHLPLHRWRDGAQRWTAPAASVVLVTVGLWLAVRATTML
ncbi:MAG: hypothetical protein R2755_21565 [Acidimicrobiales bacterium]